MKTYIYIFFASIILGLSIISCGAYSFTGGNTGDAKTIQIDFFPNQASLVEPSLSQKFTLDLQDLFTRQTNLTLTSSGGDLHFEGEITDYRITPMSATAQQTAAQNRLTITVNVRFTNRLNEKDDFEKQFSFYDDFGANQQLSGNALEGVLSTILERITQDIFNASVAKW
ncbi:LptE family protein [Tenacibaculum maritimum]|uniref:LptE family protein n=1 Tax=Tenacibaculum maritimum TaxID=107401 RepID=UPI0012E5582C|nr:LptE family protein [Tenacibaculum maritimum]MCD9581728.1 LPS assembly lipoprotein LptE [Tenacibaculum maritimum]MCD9635831.1 LPS assembly lipoprotein LptE [Tenacibaculum maritimum]CAA0156063.1 Probable lipoprotein precursor. Putative lipopolysaccharide assembly protein LptE [Tenacibaculum maritimum]CAA0165654.1 Probable lipoprotein precursor. Putative lipopolysaccharide assembly protein LptE [Tenacibaculum maritimum]CAA0173202.1 Probable lipoprotein precursor. Putative lipopolysaccharide a